MTTFSRTAIRIGQRGLATWFVGTTLLWPQVGRASGNPLPLSISPEAAVLLALPPTFLIGVNGYYTTKAYLGPPTVTRQSARNAVYYTSWQTGIISSLAFLGFVGNSPGTHRDTAMAFWAIGTWPMSLTAHGLRYSFPDSPAVGTAALGVVTVADLGMLAYDVAQLAEARRVDAFYAVTETVVGTLQGGFGVFTAMRAEPSHRALVWSMTALPVTLAAHGVLSLILPEKMDEPVRDTLSPIRAQWHMPNLILAPIPEGFLAQAQGFW